MLEDLSVAEYIKVAAQNKYLFLPGIGQQNT